MLYCELHLDSQACNGHLVIKESACCPCSGGRTADSWERTVWFPRTCWRAGCIRWPSPGCAWGNMVTGWAWPSVGGDRREPWVQGSQHGAACGVQVGEQERGQPRIQVSGRERVLGVMNSCQCHSTKPVCKVWGRDKKTFWGSDSAPRSDPVPSSILS